MLQRSATTRRSGYCRGPSRQNGGQRSYSDEDVRRFDLYPTLPRVRLPYRNRSAHSRHWFKIVHDRALEARDPAYEHLTAFRAKLRNEGTRAEHRRAFIESCDNACVVIPDLIASSSTSSAPFSVAS
jgi:hypothetical protein